jgi:hypothetical protein
MKWSLAARKKEENEKEKKTKGEKVKEVCFFSQFRFEVQVQVRGSSSTSQPGLEGSRAAGRNNVLEG